MDTVDDIDNYRNEVIRLKAEIEELERKKETHEWLSVGAVSYHELSRFVLVNWHLIMATFTLQL